MIALVIALATVLVIAFIVIVHLDGRLQDAGRAIAELRGYLDINEERRATLYDSNCILSKDRDHLCNLLKATLFVYIDDRNVELTPKDLQEVEAMRLRSQVNGVTHITSLTVQPEGSVENKGEFL